MTFNFIHYKAMINSIIDKGNLEPSSRLKIIITILLYFIEFYIFIF